MTVNDVTMKRAVRMMPDVRFKRSMLKTRWREKEERIDLVERFICNRNASFASIES